MAEIRELNAWLAKYCADYGYIYLDYYDSLADAKGAMLPGDSFDGVHPTEKGYADHDSTGGAGHCEGTGKIGT